METNQTAKMVAWLDEERRKDKATITRLEERAASQAALIEDQTRRLQELEGQLTTLRTTIPSVSMFEETIARLRSEINTGIEQLETRRSTTDQELKKMRDMDRDSIMKAVEDLRQEVITRIDRAMAPRRAEEERLSRVAVELQTYADNLSKGLEEFERSLNFLEEQRRQDTRRLSDINGEMAEAGKRIDAQQAKLELLEDLSRRNERGLTELTGVTNELKQQRQAWMEEQALAEQQRERTMNDMIRRMDSFAEDMLGYTKQFESWAETQRVMKKYIDDFERIVDRVERRLNELGEAQRLSEERFRQEWEESQADDQKRWRQFTITNEEAWRENAKSLEGLQTLVAQSNERLERQGEYIQHLLKLQQDAFSTFSEHLDRLRDLAEDTHSSLPSLT